MTAAPVKRAPRKAPAKRPVPKGGGQPGDPGFDWGKVYPKELHTFKFMSDDGFVVELPWFSEPGEGEVFGLMLLNKSESDLLVYVMRQHIMKNAIDPDGALLITFQALQRMKSPGTIERLLKQWPEAAGLDLGKYSQS